MVGKVEVPIDLRRVLRTRAAVIIKELGVDDELQFASYTKKPTDEKRSFYKKRKEGRKETREMITSLDVFGNRRLGPTREVDYSLRNVIGGTRERMQMNLILVFLF